MSTRLLLRSAPCALLFFVACEQSPDPAGGGASEGEPVPIAGMYEVSGTTIEPETGRRREISGTVILNHEGANYTATYHLATVFEGGDGVLPAEVVGSGNGSIEGRTLRGKAATQLVISTIPGVDPAFAYIPRTTTTRLVSKSVTTIADDGSMSIEIENSPAAGESYAPTRTVLHGVRIGAPDVASAPPRSAAPGDDPLRARKAQRGR